MALGAVLHEGHAHLRGDEHLRHAHLGGIAHEHHLAVLDALALGQMLDHGEEVAHLLGGMVVVGHAVDHGDRRVLRQLYQVLVTVDARFEDVQQAAHNAGRVLDGLVPAQLDGAGRVELARAAEVGHGALERQARAGGHLLEDHAQRLMFQQLGVVPGLHAALEHARQLDHVEQLVLREIVGIEKILDGHRKASFESELNGQPVVAAAPARCGEDKPARPDCSTAAPCPQL